MKSIPAKNALRNRSSLGTAALWSVPTPATAGTGSEEVSEDNGGNRVYADHLALKIRPKFKLKRDLRVFASGSCFAREIELALHNSGVDVMSWKPGIGIENSTFHRYNTFSIINDFDFAFRRQYGPEFITKLADDKYADFTGHGSYPTLEAAIETRNKVIALHRQSVD
jgi:hypothetical protein